MYETEIKNMDLGQLAKSGQCFRMRPAAETECGGIWSAAAGEQYVEIMQDKSRFLFSCEEAEFEGILTPPPKAMAACRYSSSGSTERFTAS